MCHVLCRFYFFVLIHPDFTNGKRLLDFFLKRRKRQTMRLTLNETPLFYERRGFLHSSGSSDGQGIKSSNSAESIFSCLSQRFGNSVRIYLE